MKVNSVNDLGQFIEQLKAWAEEHSYQQIVSSIESAEKTSFTASELIIKYAELLKFLKNRCPDSIPSRFRDEWDQAIRVGLEAVETVEYPEKKRAFFSLG